MTEEKYFATGVQSGTNERVSATGATKEEAVTKLSAPAYTVYPASVNVYKLPEKTHEQ